MAGATVAGGAAAMGSFRRWLEPGAREEREVDDAEIILRIGELADEERRLEEAHVGEGLSEDDHTRLDELQVTLDQLWDLLRQRRALRNAGRDAGEAVERPSGTVEGYLQ